MLLPWILRHSGWSGPTCLDTRRWSWWDDVREGGFGDGNLRLWEQPQLQLRLPLWQFLGGEQILFYLWGKSETGRVQAGRPGNCTLGDALALLSASGRQEKLLVRDGQYL